MPATWPALIFLDIDGVLNGHDYLAECRSSKIDRHCIHRLNRVLKATGARIILSSAWRYMIHGHAMSLDGFSYMLRTHGMIAPIDDKPESRIIIDVTCRDEDIQLRADQVRAAMEARSNNARYVVVDDLDLGFTDARMPFVQTDGQVGLTDTDADRIIAMLAEPVDDSPCDHRLVNATRKDG